LNGICREGWELVNGSFVSVMVERESEENRAQGANSIKRDRMAGDYLFRRSEANWREPSDPF
jgi:hypothetical protein